FAGVEPSATTTLLRCLCTSVPLTGFHGTEVRDPGKVCQLLPHDFACEGTPGPHAMKTSFDEYMKTVSEWTQFPQSLNKDGVIDSAKTTFVFGQWAISGEVLAKLLGLVDVRPAVATIAPVEPTIQLKQAA